jgi:hypothetical protein
MVFWVQQRAYIGIAQTTQCSTVKYASTHCWGELFTSRSNPALENSRGTVLFGLFLHHDIERQKERLLVVTLSLESLVRQSSSRHIPGEDDVELLEAE